jgi:hypothetical protein
MNVSRLLIVGSRADEQVKLPGMSDGEKKYITAKIKVSK